MSLKEEAFYAIRCDFPGCGDLNDGGEYRYRADPYYDLDSAQDNGWLVDTDNDTAYCSEHVVTGPCPNPDECDEYGCDFDEREHLFPMPDTFENRLKIAMDRVVSRAHRALDQVERKYLDRHGELGEFSRYANSTRSKLTAIWERTCRAYKPDITPQELHDLRMGKPMRKVSA